jgi:type II secretory pathway component GspD/PulD (secretin)
MQGLARTSSAAQNDGRRFQRGVCSAIGCVTAIVCGAILLSAAQATPSSSSTSSTATHTLAVHRAASVTSDPSPNDVTLDFVAADINDVLKALAVQSGANIVSSADVKGTITVSLAHVTLEEALDMVARLSGYQYAHVNNAYIVGTPSGIAAFATPGGSSTAPQITDVVALHYTTVEDATNLIKLRFPAVQVSAGEQINGAKVGGSTSAILLYGPQDEVDQAKALVDDLEESLSQQVANESTESYQVKYASLPDCITVLNTLDPSLVVTPGPALQFKATAPSAASAAASSSASSSSSGGSSSGGSAGGSGASSSSLTGPSILLLTGTAQDIAKGLDVLSKIDMQPVQLLFETKVTEISDNDQNNLGLNWNFSGATTTIGELVPTGYVPGAAVNPVNYPGQILKIGTIGRSPITNLATVSLDAMITDGKAKLLADPNIGSIDGYPAQVFIGDTLNYIQSITTSTTGENITTASVQVGVTLRVTGKCSGDGYITLNIHPEVSSIEQWVSVPGGGELPDIATRFADTTVRVKDGQTIAIGGLIQESDLLNVNKVPFLGDLPFLGALFRDNQHNKTKDEVVFFLKTSVMKNS